MAKRQSAGTLEKGPTISIPSFCHGADGNATGCRGGVDGFADLSTNWHTPQDAIKCFTCLHRAGHQYCSRSRCFVLVVPGWDSWAASKSRDTRDEGTTIWSPRSRRSPTTENSGRTRWNTTASAGNMSYWTVVLRQSRWRQASAPRRQPTQALHTPITDQQKFSAARGTAHAAHFEAPPAQSGRACRAIQHTEQQHSSLCRHFSPKEEKKSPIPLAPRLNLAVGFFQRTNLEPQG